MQTTLLKASQQKEIGYALENERESQRLERQAQARGYEYEPELVQLQVRSGDLVLDAGCGSGVVSRMLAMRSPGARVVACDSSRIRIQQARIAASMLQNLSFVEGDISDLPFDDDQFSIVVCRYVLHHLSDPARSKAIRELLRCLKPGGRILCIEPDGIFFNLFPRPEVVSTVLAAIERVAPVDLYMGRKLPHLFKEVGFTLQDWRVATMVGSSDVLPQEAQLMEERLEQLQPFLTTLLEDADQARSFAQAFLGALRTPGTAYFCNKFIVSARK